MVVRLSKEAGDRRKLKETKRTQLVQIPLRNPTFSTQNVCNRLNEFPGTPVSKSTVFKGLKLSGIKKKLAKTSPKITSEQEKKRF